MSWNIKTPGDYINGPLTVAGTATITGALTLTGGTANGVPYLNASKVVTTGTNLSFANTPGYFDSTLNINSLLGSALYRGGITVSEDNVGFTLFGGSGYKLIQTSGFSTPNQLSFYASNAEQYRIGASGVFTWLDGAGGTRMTLDSTGLGIGASPAAKLHVTDTSVAAATALVRFVGQSSYNLDIQSVNNSVSTVGNRFNFNIGSAGGEFSFSNSGGTRMYLGQSGNLGIGVTPSAWQTGLKVLQLNTNAVLYGNGTNGSFFGTNFFTDSTGTNKYLLSSQLASAYGQVSGQHQWFNAPDSGVSGAGTTAVFTQAMTLNASGNLLLGAATAQAQGRQEITFDGATAQGLNVIDSSAAATSTAIAFIKNAVQCGSIVVTAVATTYNTSSDYRLKESVKPISGGLARVNALKPSIYKWKSNGSDGEGFLAHELAEVVPFAVSGEKDAVNADGTIKSQGIDMSRVIPILVAAIQELTARVQTLETR
jgi:hypothetical protein